MTNRALRIGQLIANAHPADVRLLFDSYGITVQPTGKTILDAYLVYGNEFLYKLLAIASKSVSNFSSVTDTGLETEKLLANAQALQAKAQAEQAAKTSWLDKAVSIFSTAGTALTTVAGAWNDITTVFNGGKVVDTGTGDANTAMQAEIYKLQLEAQAEQERSQTKTYLLIGFGVVVLILGFIMYQKRH